VKFDVTLTMIFLTTFTFLLL